MSKKDKIEGLKVGDKVVAIDSGDYYAAGDKGVVYKIEPERASSIYSGIRVKFNHLEQGQDQYAHIGTIERLKKARKSKFKVGDEVIVKYIKIETRKKTKIHEDSFSDEMAKVHGKKMIIESSPYKDWYKITSENALDNSFASRYNFHKSWLKHAKPKGERISDLEVRVEEPYGDVMAVQPEIEQWNPKGGGFWVNDGGMVTESPTHEACCNFGTEFETEEQATKGVEAFRRYHRLYQLALELNEGWEPDWSDSEQLKYLILKSHYISKITTISSVYHENLSCVYFKSQEAALKAIEIIENGGL